MPVASIVQFAILLPSFPVAKPVLKCTTPSVEEAPAPLIVEFNILLLEASLINLIVLPLAVTSELKIVKEAPPTFKPSMVTLSAPFNTTNEPATAPEIVTAVAACGLIVIEE